MINPFRAFLFLIALGSLTSCQKGTYLEVVFKGPGLPPIHHIHFALTLSDGTVSAGDLPKNAPAGNVVGLPASAAFQLDDHSGPLMISATAFDASNAQLAQASASTTIMHGKTWTVDVNFVPTAGDDGGVADAVAPPDATNDLVVITDGSLVDGVTGCVTATVQATESVSLDYNSSGPEMDTGNMLWANIGPAERYIGWMKFGVRFVPRASRITKATLNLWMAQSSGGVPQLVVDYSSIDGWTRKSKANEVQVGAVISTGGPYLAPNPPPASTPYALDPNHDWSLDLSASDGTITLGIENTAIASAAAVASKVVFYGVDHLAPVDSTRPTLDLEICSANQ